MPGSAEPGRAFADLAAWWDERLVATGVPGAALGVVVGHRRFTHSYGVGEVGSAVPVSPATTFRIASLTKIFTATALARLAHAGRLDLGTPVRETLGGFSVADAATSAAVTTTHLLTHSAGWADAIEPDPDHDLGQHVDLMRDLPQVAPVGSRLSYSNSGYLLAGHLLATVGGRDYEQLVRSEVIEPLGLAHTGFATLAHTGFAAGDRSLGPGARGHAMSENGPVLLDPEVPPRAANPAYGLVSSVDDLLTFLEAQLAAAGDRTSPFSTMLTASGPGGSVGPTVVDRVGLGWMLQEFDGHRTAMSQGSDAGYCAGMALSPADGFAVVVLTNSDAALMLVNDTLEQGLALLVGAAVPTPPPVAPDPADLEAAAGRYALWDGMTFEVSAGTGGPVLGTSVGGEDVPVLTGPLVSTEADRGYLAALGGRVWFDFVRGDGGDVDWLRFAGRLAPRVG